MTCHPVPHRGGCDTDLADFGAAVCRLAVLAGVGRPPPTFSHRSRVPAVAMSRSALQAGPRSVSDPVRPSQGAAPCVSGLAPAPQWGRSAACTAIGRLSVGFCQSSVCLWPWRERHASSSCVRWDSRRTSPPGTGWGAPGLWAPVLLFHVGVGGQIALVMLLLTFWALTSLQKLPPANKQRHLLFGEIDDQPWAAPQKQFSQARDRLAP